MNSLDNATFDALAVVRGSGGGFFAGAERERPGFGGVASRH